MLHIFLGSELIIKLLNIQRKKYKTLLCLEPSNLKKLLVGQLDSHNYQNM